MSESSILQTQLQQRFADTIQSCCADNGAITLEIPRQALKEVCFVLRDESPFQFEQLIDVCGVDYSDYGVTQWDTQRVTGSGFSRGVDNTQQQRRVVWDKPRFATVYHLLSLHHNQRLRIRTFLEEDAPRVDSVISIWPSADWFEREAFDLFGIFFDGHPDCRRILTDYGFIGHPFRKDFPLSGHVEVRYDEKQQRVIYEPVSIEPRTLVPKVIRSDYRYIPAEEKPRD